MLPCTSLGHLQVLCMAKPHWMLPKREVCQFTVKASVAVRTGLPEADHGAHPAQHHPQPGANGGRGGRERADQPARHRRRPQGLQRRGRLSGNAPCQPHLLNWKFSSLCRSQNIGIHMHKANSRVFPLAGVHEQPDVWGRGHGVLRDNCGRGRRGARLGRCGRRDLSTRTHHDGFMVGRVPCATGQSWPWLPYHQ